MGGGGGGSQYVLNLGIRALPARGLRPWAGSHFWAVNPVSYCMGVTSYFNVNGPTEHDCLNKNIPTEFQAMTFICTPPSLLKSWTFDPRCSFQGNHVDSTHLSSNKNSALKKHTQTVLLQLPCHWISCWQMTQNPTWWWKTSTSIRCELFVCPLFMSVWMGVSGFPCRIYEVLMSYVIVTYLCPCRMSNLGNCHMSL